MAANVKKWRAGPNADPCLEMPKDVTRWARSEPVRHELQLPTVIHSECLVDKPKGPYGSCNGKTDSASDDVIILANDIKKNKDVNEKIRQNADMIETASRTVGRVRMDGEGYGR